MTSQDYRLDDARRCANVAILAIKELSLGLDTSEDNMIFWVRTSARAALKYIETRDLYDLCKDYVV